ncbi:rhodanese-related sulfurtransferase [Humitalea rosea]|uniref:Rhodanese-related sulfurtransferase n=1 Tax=Humitalea rosea TaxID=990373 RepID=A0A2W7ICP1_9PROT|nr:rhodanese-like domain-containing protein [Humitalea rosea]PZW44726.1 rhodanese-related sulfurtransferase [Humitalea rosea]
MIRRIAPATLKSWIADGQELAILDAREEGLFGTAHLFWAVPCPLSQAEWRAPQLLPRLATRIVVCDGGEGEAEQLIAVLQGLGAADVSLLAGGTPAWARAGYEVFSGVNVPSKAFGEWVEHHDGTPHVAPETLAAMKADGEPLVVLDSRPFDEFHAMSIPGGINVPGGELVYRLPALKIPPEATIVVNCAGRTRSILGAESLRQAGVPNRVVALRDGTMGWELAGFHSDHGKTARFPPGPPPDVAATRAAAEAFATRNGVRIATTIPVALERTTYVLDVREPEEFAQAHLAGSVSAPGGQLVQATDRWVAVRHARIVLVDDDGVRARMTAGWLRRLGGWEVWVLDGAMARARAPAPATAPTMETIGTEAFRALHAAGAVVTVQLGRSLASRAGAVPGAVWGVRRRLGAVRARLGASLATELVVVADPVAAEHASAELRALFPGMRVRLLAGGAAGCGLPLVTDRTNPPDEACIDAYLRPYDRNSGQEAAMRTYLGWEVDLPAQVARDGDARFGAW